MKELINDYLKDIKMTKKSIKEFIKNKERYIKYILKKLFYNTFFNIGIL